MLEIRGRTPHPRDIEPSASSPELPGGPDTEGWAAQSGGALSVSIVTGLQVVLDFVVIVGAAMLCWYVTIGHGDPASIDRYLSASIIAATMSVGVLSFRRFYDFEVISQPQAHLGGLLASLTMAFLALLFLAFSLGHADTAYSRVWAYVFLAVSTGLFLFERHLSARLIFFLAHRGHVVRNIVIVGGAEQGIHLVDLLTGRPAPWIRIIGFFDDRLERIAATVASYPLLGGVDDLVAFSRTHRIDDIFVAMPWVAEDRLRAVFERLRVIPANVHLSPEMLSSRLDNAKLVSYFGVTALRVARKPVDGWNYVLKSAEDRVIATVALLLLLPLLLVIAIAIRLETPGPVLFRQKRYGFNNNLIAVYKFRSLYHDDADVDATRQVTKDDARVTRCGRILRKFSLDELPQLFNVLKGDMSIVGPRPHAVQTKAAGRLFEDVAEQYAQRHKVKPGITGWAQVNGWRGETDTEEKLISRVEHDLFYMENWSTLFDLKIILMTLWVLVFGDAY